MPLDVEWRHRYDPVDQAMTGAPCALCGSPRTSALYRECRNRREGIPGVFDVLRCAACGIAFVSPRPTPELLAALYDTGYHSHIATSGRGPAVVQLVKACCLWSYRWRFGHERGTVPPFGQGRLLDVGCGTGDYLAAMAALGWQGTGCDVSGPALAAARRRVPGAAWHQGPIEAMPVGPVAFDLITLWHTLEHLPNPVETLRHLRTRLAPGGRLLLAVPNIESVEARMFGRRWVEIDMPSHLLFFSTATLQAVLGQAGLVCTRIRPQVHPSTVSDACGFLIDDLLGLQRSRQRLWLYGALYPWTVMSYALGNWGCLEVTAMKP